MAHLTLRAKSLLALALACLLVLVPALFIGWQLTERVRAHFGQAYADNLTLLNRQRILAPIAVDFALSLRLAQSEITRQWLRNEEIPSHRALFFSEAEGYRADLRDHAYFVASARSGDYYFNDDSSPVSGSPRYTLDPDDPADSWFYASMGSSAPYNININPDAKLGVTRVWINAAVRDGKQTLGMIGASIDLTEFLQSLAGSGREGVLPMVIDNSGAIQAHPDRSRIAFNSGATPASSHVTVFDGLEPAAAQLLMDAMESARMDPDMAHSVRMQGSGHRHLASIAYAPELDWYVLTYVDPAAAQVVGVRWLWSALAGTVFLMALLLAAFGYGVERMVLRPIRRLQQSARAIADGRYDIRLPTHGGDEIGDLGRAFGAMADQVSKHTALLEDRVRERTAELETANTAMALAHKKIGDSIEYASLIQRAILPERELLQAFGAQHFVLWRPRDVVGGDLYVYRADGDNCLLGIMDCAGHGVSGALMTMLARAAIDLAIQDVGPTDPAAVLTRCDRAMRAMLAEAQQPKALATSVETGLVYIDRHAGRLLFAGARLSLYASDGRQVREYPGGRRPLLDTRTEPYRNTEVPLEAAHSFYLVTDGFLDQAGGERGYGFGNERFRAMLTEHGALPLTEQLAVFCRVLSEYQGSHPQRDDITLLSFQAS